MGRRKRTWSWCRTGKLDQQTPPSSLGHLCHHHFHSWPGQTDPGVQHCCWHCYADFQTRRPLQRACAHLFEKWEMEWAQVQAARVSTTKLLSNTLAVWLICYSHLHACYLSYVETHPDVSKPHIKLKLLWKPPIVAKCLCGKQRLRNHSVCY